MKFKQILVGFVGAVAIVAATGYWYVMVAGAPQLDPPPVTREATGMRFQLETFHSAALGQTRTYGIILPPDYAKHAHQRYPVVVLLHGGHGDARAWQDKAAVITVLHNLYKQHQIPPLIVVTPDGNDRRGTSPFWDPQYFNRPNGKIDTLIGNELVQVLKSRYRVLPAPQFWAMGGQSSGGWGALNIGLRHLNHFQVLFSHSGYFTDTSGPTNSPQNFVEKLPQAQRDRLHVYLDAGADEERFLTSTRTFHHTLDQLGIDNVFHVFPGGHGIAGPNSGWNYWNKHLADSLRYVANQFEIAGWKP